MELTRLNNIEQLAYEGNVDELKIVFGHSFTQLEIDVALEIAIAHSHLTTADYLLTLGARFENYNYQGVYYAVHNNQLEGLKYAVSKGVDININDGMPLTTSVITTLNTKDLTLFKWLLANGADKKYLTQEHFNLVAKYGTDEFKELINKVQYTVT